MRPFNVIEAPAGVGGNFVTFPDAVVGVLAINPRASLREVRTGLGGGSLSDIVKVALLQAEVSTLHALLCS